MLQQRIERFRQMQMKLDELTQPGWEDVANYFHDWDKKYGTSKIGFPAVVQPQMDDNASAPAQTLFDESMECLGILPGISQILPGIPRPDSSHIRLGLVESYLNTSTPILESALERNTLPFLNVTPVKPLSCYPVI
jgi:hypothetical protein